MTDELEVIDIPGDDTASPLVLMHGGLGSAQLWDEFPQRLREATGRRTVAFSRHGHGWSDRPPKPRTPSFMHEEAQAMLPQLLERLHVTEPVLIGHSDGASIGLIYAASNPVEALVAIAPHVFVEQKCIEEIAKTKERYLHGDLRDKMAPHHNDVDAAFFGWADVWLDPEFPNWDIRDRIPRITAPMLLIQGVDDQFGTLAQLDEIERLSQAPVTRVHLEDCRHAPFVQKPDETVAAVAEFVNVAV